MIGMLGTIVVFYALATASDAAAIAYIGSSFQTRAGWRLIIRAMPLAPVQRALATESVAKGVGTHVLFLGYGRWVLPNKGGDILVVQASLQSLLNVDPV